MLGELIKSIIGPILGPLIDRIPDPNERARAKEAAEKQMIEAMTGLVQGQLEINKAEAEHASIFVAGARPAILWICALSLFWTFVIYPVAQWVAFLYGVNLDGMPRLDSGELMSLTLGLLGLAGLRTYERSIGVERNTIFPAGKNLGDR